MANRYWVGGTATWDSTAGTKWALTSGGAGGQAVPTSSDDVFFDASSSGGVGLATIITAKSIDFTGFTGIFNHQTSSYFNIFGNLTVSSGMTFGTLGELYFIFNGNATIYSNGKTLTNCLIAGSSSSIVVSLGDDLVITHGIGDGAYCSFTTNNFDCTCGVMKVGSGGTFNFGTSLVTITKRSGFATQALQVNAGGTINAGNSTIKFTDSTDTALGFYGGGGTYGKVWFSRGASTGDITITGSNTFNEFVDDGTSAHSMIITAETTQTFGDFDVGGGLGEPLTLESTAPGTQYILSVSSGVNTYSYLNFQDCFATGGAQWVYDSTCSNISNNEGWYAESELISPEEDGWTRLSFQMQVPIGTSYLRAVLSASGSFMKFDDGQVEENFEATSIEEEFIGDLILPKRAIRAEVGFNNYNIPKFIGLTNKFVPNISEDTIQIYSYDLADRLKDIIIEDKYFENKRTDELIVELASLAGIGVEQLSLETGTSTIEFAYFQEASIWTYMNQIAEAEGGRIFFDETGRLIFWNRTHYRDNSDIRYTFDFTDDIIDLDYEISKAKVKNRIYVKGYPKKKLTDVRIYNDTTIPSISAGDTQEFFCQYNYLQEVSVPALNVQVPVIGTDIIANTAEDGSGSNISSDISISSYFIFRESMRINLHNDNASTAYLRTFRIYGDPIVIARRIENIKEDENSQSLYDVQELQIENNFITTDEYAETLATQKLAELKDPRDFIKIDVVGVPYLQLGDIVSVQRSFAGEYENFHIVKNAWVFKDDFIQSLELEKKVII